MNTDAISHSEDHANVTYPHHLFQVGVASIAVVLATSCTTPPHRPSSNFVDGNVPRVLGVQFAPVTGNDGYETAEVFLWNDGPSPVTFTNAVLDGASLGGGREQSARAAAGRFRFDIGGQRVAAPKPVENEAVLWSQFQPDSTLAPNSGAVFQIGFRGQAAQRGVHDLALAVDNGMVLTATVPRAVPPRRRITAIAWAADGSSVTVQHSRGAPPSSLRLNGRPLAFRVLAPAVAGRPGAVVADLPNPVRNGDSALLELDFGADGIRRAFLRVMPAVAIDAPAHGADARQLPAETRAAFGLDETRTFTRLPFDVACDDSRAGRPGDHAEAVAAARLAAFRANPTCLHGVDFCTALYGSIWNIYAAMTDCVIVKPYQLHWGPNPARFIEDEIAHIDRAVAAAAPRPAIWVPDRFRRRRHLEGRELELLAWSALLRGAKGVRHHFWLNSGAEPFADCADIAETLPRLNRDIARLRPILSPLVPASSSMDRRAMASVLEGWCGDAGALLLVRNMRYATDEEPNDGGRTPRFRVTPSENVSLSYALPPWLDAAASVDALTGEDIPSVRDGDRLTLSLPSLDAFRLVWIPNASARRDASPHPEHTAWIPNAARQSALFQIP